MATDRVELKVGITSDRRQVYLEIANEREPLAHIFLGPGEAEEVAQKIADSRASLVEEVNRDLDPNPRLLGIFDPIWRTRLGKMQDQEGIVLALRHPGLGWLSFLLPHKEAAALGRWLVENSKPQPSGPNTEQD